MGLLDLANNEGFQARVADPEKIRAQRGPSSPAPSQAPSGQQPAQGAEQPEQPQQPGPAPVLSAEVDEDGVPDNYPEMDGNEKAMAEAVLTNIKEFIASDDGFEKIAARIKNASANKPAPEVVGDLAAQMLSTEMQQAEAAGRKVPGTIIMGLGTEIVHDLTEVSVSLGIARGDDDNEVQKFQSHAMLRATDEFKRINGVDEAELRRTADHVRSGAYDAEPEALTGGIDNGV